MTTKISKILDIILETGWLLIFFLVPLIFLPSIIYSVVHIAEYVLFQTLVEIIVFVWILKLIICSNQNILKLCKFGMIVSNLQDSFRQKEDGRKHTAVSFLPFILPATIFIIILGIATVFSQSPHMSFFGDYFRKMGYITWLHFFSFFLVLFFNLKNKKQIMRIFYTIVGAAALSVFYGFIQISGLDPSTWNEPAYQTRRIFSTLGQPNFFASWLLLTIPVIVGLLIYKSVDIRCRQTIFKQYFLRPLLTVLFFLSIFALVFTQSRGGWIGFFFGFFFFTFIFSWIKNYKRIGIFLLTLLIICIGTIVYFNFHPLNFDSGDNYIEKRAKTLTKLTTYGERRLITWKNSIDLIKQKPLIGYGPNTPEIKSVSKISLCARSGYMLIASRVADSGV